MCYKHLSLIVLCLLLLQSSRFLSQPNHFTRSSALPAQAELMFCSAGPRVAVFTSGCINSVSCCSARTMKAAAAGPLRARNKRPCLPFSPTLSFCFCPLNNLSHVVLTPRNLMLSITPMRLEGVTMARTSSLESTEPSHAHDAVWDKEVCV